MKNIKLYSIAPAIPEKLKFLEELSNNLWWCWNINAKKLFKRIDPDLWGQSRKNPLLFLSLLPQSKFSELEENVSFLAHLNEVQQDFEADVKRPIPGNEDPRQGGIAYFSMEFGIHESVRLYSGGLGILAGDHLKSSSDLQLPLAAVGLLYRDGYFSQNLSYDGWQQEKYPQNNFQHLPIKKAYNKNGRQLRIYLNFPDGEMQAVVWQMDVGRIPLFLLDTNIPENPERYKGITAQLYGGNKEMRLRQELLLSIGGYNVLKELDYTPSVYHINEGHAAFVSIPRLNDLMQKNDCSYDSALEIIHRTSVFTTHTPVPAGNETFKLDLLYPYLESVMKKYVISPEQILSTAGVEINDNTNYHTTEMSMTVLGLSMASKCNGVSELHGQVARTMWKHLWHHHPDDEIPISHITNGVHCPSWVSEENAILLDRYIGPEWRNGTYSDEVFERINQIPDEEIWRAHSLNCSRFVSTIRNIISKNLKSKNAPISEIKKAQNLLNPDHLIIGFARRFATYKRATLILQDMDRLRRILLNPDRPVQLVFAGKAHPADDGGKHLIQEIFNITKDPELSKHVIFLEDYDMYSARNLVQGVDIWLNTPLRPYEASGTSGMKAAMNGALNFSVLDGWWCEGYNGKNGWAIGSGEEYDDHEYQNAIEAQALYNTLEEEIVPKYYNKVSGVPKKWVFMMKESIKTGLCEFSSHRMVNDYNSRYYQPIINKQETSIDESISKRFIALKEHWHEISLTNPVIAQNLFQLHVGDTFTVTAEVHLGSINPEEVAIELYYGPITPKNEVSKSHSITMEHSEPLGDGKHLYKQEISCIDTGRFGYTTRAVPKERSWRDIMPGLITWAHV